MSTIKYYTPEGWKALYIDMIREALLAKNNLSDLTNREEARKNLDIYGTEVETHRHDSLYYSKTEVENIIKGLENKIDDLKKEVEEQQIANKITSLSELVEMKNGCYKWFGTLDGIGDVWWIILKTEGLYTATNMSDPRVVLRSNNLTDWLSSYAYWHV